MQEITMSGVEKRHLTIYFKILCYLAAQLSKPKEFFLKGLRSAGGYYVNIPGVFEHHAKGGHSEDEERLEATFNLSKEKLQRAMKMKASNSFDSSVNLKLFKKSGEIEFHTKGLYPGALIINGIGASVSGWNALIDEFISLLLIRFFSFLCFSRDVEKKEILAAVGCKKMKDLKVRNKYIYWYLTTKDVTKVIPNFPKILSEKIARAMEE